MLQRNEQNDDQSAVTYITEASSCARNPVSVQLSQATSKLELQLDFLARELELEKSRRQNLQEQVGQLALVID